MSAPLQTGLADDPNLVSTALQVAGFGLAAFFVAAAVAVVYRWYTRERVPLGLSMLFGIAVVAVYLNTLGLFSEVVGSAGGANLFELDVVLVNVATLGLAAVATPGGRLVGDRLATDVFAFVGVRELDAEVSRVVQSVGRVTPLELPDEVRDIDGYDPVSNEKKAEMAGKTLLFPRRLTVGELEDRLETRLKDDYGVGHVDVELDADGTVTYLAVGSRVAGIGPTLGPGACAVAIRGDPPNSASPGDVLQVWRTDPVGRVVTGELRATVDDVVTLVVDESEASKLDATTTYRLVTLPAEPQVDREFASLLRVATETMGAITIRSGSPLVGEAVGSLDVTVAAIRPSEGTVEAIPSRTRPLAVGDTLFVVARPDALRRLESAAAPES